MEGGVVKIIVSSVAAFALVLPVVAGAQPRSLSHKATAAAVEGIAIHSGVGEIRVVAGTTDEITVVVDLEPKRGGPFGSSSRIAKSLELAQLLVQDNGAVLKLRVDAPRLRKRDFNERWSVELPARLALTIKAGVGDIRVEGVAGAVVVDAGVGDVRILDARGPVRVDAGVGDVLIEGEHASYGPINARCGVGGTSLRTPHGRVGGQGFIGKSLTASGPGEATIRVGAGVGEVRIRLR
jgi:hypothetical protein